DVSCFFFSSRRRHTRWPRDWSSDVCSSDLRTRSPCVTWMFTTAGVTALTMEENPWDSWGGTAAAVLSFNAGGANTSTATTTPAKIGRASCRERGEDAGVGAGMGVD